MSFEKFHLAILGSHTVIGAEIARLAVALGHDVMGFGPEPSVPVTYREEPWTHGVQWRHHEDLDALSTCDRLALCAHLHPDVTSTHEVRLWVARALDSFPGDVIVVAPESSLDEASWRELVRTRATRDGRLVWMSPAEIVWMPGYQELPEGVVMSDAMVQRVETVAMAALRVVLEDERLGIIRREQIAHLGDAMMIQ